METKKLKSLLGKGLLKGKRNFFQKLLDWFVLELLKVLSPKLQEEIDRKTEAAIRAFLKDSCESEATKIISNIVVDKVEEAIGSIDFENFVEAKVEDAVEEAAEEAIGNLDIEDMAQEAVDCSDARNKIEEELEGILDSLLEKVEITIKK